MSSDTIAADVALPRRSTRQGGVVVHPLRPGLYGLAAAAWAGAVLFALLSNLGGASVHLRNAARYQVPLEETWLSLLIWLLPPLLLVWISLLLLRSPSRQPIAVLLAMTLALLANTSDLAPLTGTFWYPMHPVPPHLLILSTAVEKLAWLGMILAFFRFPSGVFAPHWTKSALVGLVFMEVITAFLYIRDPDRWGGLEFTADLIVLGTGLAALVHRTSQMPAGRARSQLRVVIFGVSGLLLAYLAWLLLNWLGEHLAAAPDSKLGWVTLFLPRLAGLVYSFGGVWLGLALLIALLRYGLYDGNKVVSRSVTYSILAAAVSLILLVGKEVGDHVLGTVAGDHEAIRTVIAGAFALLVVGPAKSSVLGWADRSLRTPLAELTHELPKALEEMRGIASLEDVLLETASRTNAALDPCWLAVVVEKEVAYSERIETQELHGWLERAELSLDQAVPPHEPADSVFPFRVPLRLHSGRVGQPLGWLLVGPPEDGGSYSDEDRAAVCEVGRPLARAIRAVDVERAAH